MISLLRNTTLMALPAITISESTLIMSGEGVFLGFLIGMDAINDATITIYDNTSGTGEEIVPTNTYDASAIGLNGWSPAVPIRVRNGLYINISCSGTCEVTPFYANFY